ncbi:MAG: SDR family NAD(P)-dependent oxidoreductase [Clostridia bacterium]|nr:SDR family NAD(P)-dependent oxidoreductase [Clostridia bacterium]
MKKCLVGKRILVTGGAGFIGSHLCEKLISEGNEVIIVDNFNSFYDPALKRDNIEEIKSILKEKDTPQKSLKVFEYDIRDLDALDQLFSKSAIDIVVHLAAMAGVRPSIEEPLLYEEVNIKGTMNLLEICKKYSVNKFIFASSSSVYGNNQKVPFSETDNVDFPISPYAATKKAGELLCYTYSKLYRINIACLRFFTVYGPRQRPDLAIYKFVESIFKDLPIPFYGDGMSKRDYTYIDDIVHGIVQAIYWADDGEDKYGIFNIGESKAISLSEMINVIEHAVGKKAMVKRMPMQPGDVNQTFADIERAKTVLGYQPVTSFKKGVEFFVKWYKEKRLK